MKRRSQPVKKMTRRSKPKPKFDPYEQGRYGGFLPDPPEDCVSPRFLVDPENGRRYVDLVMCGYICHGNECHRCKDYLKVTSERRERSLAAKRAAKRAAEKEKES